MTIFLPQFQSGSGALTAPVLNQVMETARMSAQQEWAKWQRDNVWRGPLLCSVEGSEALDGETGRWGYYLKEVYISAYPARDPVHDTGMWTTESIHEDYYNALNTAEFCNTATHVQGIPLVDIPGTFELKPIADDTLVLAYTAGIPIDVHEDDPGSVAVFTLQNVIAGEC